MRQARTSAACEAPAATEHGHGGLRVQVGAGSIMMMMDGTPTWNIHERDPGEPGWVHHERTPGSDS